MTGFAKFKPADNSSVRGKTRDWLIWSGALLVLALMIFRLVDFLHHPEVWRFIGEHLSHIHAGSQAITAVSCFIYGIVILVLRTRAASNQSWSKYIGCVFLILSAHYFVLFLLAAFTPSAVLSNIYGTLFSSFSNILLVSAGLSLLEADRDPFPRWNFVIQGVFAGLGLALSMLNVRCQRFPDAFASAFCIFWAGYALYRNIRYTNSTFSKLTRKISGLVVMTSVFLYASSGLFYASIPFITKWNWNIQAMNVIEDAAQKEIEKRLNQAENESQKDDRAETPVKLLDDRMEIRRLLLDTLMISLFFFLKFVVFLATFILLLGEVIFITSHYADEIFNPIIHGAGEFLTDAGITRLTVENLDTASTELYVKIPGRQKTLYVKFAWPLEADLQTDRKKNELDIDELASGAMRSGEEQRFSPPHGEHFISRYFPLTYARQLPTKVATPIIFHGTVIGCMLAISKPERNFNPREIQRLRDLSKLSTLSVQSFREKAALDQLSFRFSRILAPKPVEEFDDAIDRLVDVLQDVLDPLATGIWLDVGLQQHVSLSGSEEHQQTLLYRVGNKGNNSFQTLAHDGGSLEVLTFDLEVKPSDAPSGRRYTIGKIGILVPAHSDVLNRPILGRNPMHFRAVAARTTSAVLGVTMEFLNSVIQEFGVRINNTQPMSVGEWFGEVEAAAAKAGLLWVVAEIPGETPLLGKPDAIKKLRRLQSQDRSENGCYLRSTPLNLSKGRLWIGVRGSIYHNNQNVCSLWTSSFFQFAEMADSALHRIISNQEKILHLEHEAARSYEFATIAVTTAEIVHQIANVARDISLPLQALYEAFLLGRLWCSDERIGGLIVSLPRQADYMLELAADFKKLRDPKENVECNLRQAAEMAGLLFALPLKDRGVVLEIDIADSLIIDLPPLVTVLAIATLVDNSKDAITSGGHIKIRAWEEDGMVRCDVTDNGHGVSSEVRRRLFHERNVTTKRNGNGWGLYLVNWSLKARRGGIELTSQGPGETTFTLRFPKHNKEVNS